MSKVKTKKCPFCLEMVPYTASRCKFCGSPLSTSKRKKRNYPATILFIASLVLFAFCWHLSEKLEQRENKITELERRIDKLETHLLSEYDLTEMFEPGEIIEIDSISAKRPLGQ